MKFLVWMAKKVMEVHYLEKKYIDLFFQIKYFEWKQIQLRRSFIDSFFDLLKEIFLGIWMVRGLETFALLARQNGQFWGKKLNFS
jgi:hypothetical protein